MKSYADLLGIFNNTYINGSSTLSGATPTDAFYSTFFAKDGSATNALKQLIGLNTQNTAVAKAQMSALATVGSGGQFNQVKLSKANQIVNKAINQKGGLATISNNRTDLQLFKSNPQNFVELILDGSFRNRGNLDMLASQIVTLNGGSINLFVPYGNIDAGLSTLDILKKNADDLGIKVLKAGEINVLLGGDLQVNESRIYTAGGGHIMAWSNFGNIDAGRGSKTAVAINKINYSMNQDGYITEVDQAGIAGSGIRTAASNGVPKPGDVLLFTPNGQVIAGDAGIKGNNVFLKATKVVGASNIVVSSKPGASAVPQISSVAGNLTGASNASKAASSSAEDEMNKFNQASFNETPLADKALSMLQVFVVGFGNDQ